MADELVIAEVAEQLRMTPDGVYKLIRRGKLEAVKHSDRKTFVTRQALDAYKADRSTRVAELRTNSVSGGASVWRTAFEQAARTTPEQFLDEWRNGTIARTPETDLWSVRALALTSTGDMPAPVERREGWAVAAFTQHELA